MGALWMHVTVMIEGLSDCGEETVKPGGPQQKSKWVSHITEGFTRLFVRVLLGQAIVEGKKGLRHHYARPLLWRGGP